MSFVKLPREVLESAAWRGLGINERRLVDFLMIEHMRQGGKRNGFLLAPQRQLYDFGIGEHFVIDILLGWALAAAVSALLALLDSWWSRRRASKSAALAQPTSDLGRRLAVEDPIDLLGDVADVRRGDHVVQQSQRVPGRQRLDVEDVEACSANSLRP